MVTKKYTWAKINTVLHRNMGMTPRRITKILFKLPPGKKTYTKQTVLNAYSKLYSSPRTVSNFSSRLHKAGITQK